MENTKFYESPEMDVISVDSGINTVLCASGFTIGDYGSETVGYDEE